MNSSVLYFIAQTQSAQPAPFLDKSQILGIITGIVFGFLLQKGRVLRYDKQVGFLLLQDFTIIKFMFSAIAVGMIGINILAQMGIIEYEIKGLTLGGQLVGGVLFGIGWAICGYCPGTAVGAVGEGRIGAIWVIIGMLCGAAIYAEVYPWVKANILSKGQYDTPRLTDLLHVNQWIIISVFALAILIYYLIDRGNKKIESNNDK